MNGPRLTSYFLEAPTDTVRDTLRQLSGEDGSPIVDPDSPDARRVVAEGGTCIIPAKGGCFVVTGAKKRSWVNYLRRSESGRLR